MIVVHNNISFRSAEIINLGKYLAVKKAEEAKRAAVALNNQRIIDEYKKTGISQPAEQAFSIVPMACFDWFGRFIGIIFTPFKL